MAVKRYLNETGLSRFFNNLKTYFSGTATPSMNGVASVGSSSKLAHEDHVHPSDTSKVDLTYLKQNYLTGQAIETYLSTNYYTKSAIDSNLSTNYLTADAAEIQYATITNLVSASARIGTIESDYITSSTIDAAVANVGYLKANSAEINFVKVNKANINEAWIKDLLVQGSVIAQNGTFYELTGLHIDANDITAGTLTVDRLQLLGTDGLYYALNVNSMGETAFEQLSAAEQLACQSQIHANTIVANSITTDQITANNLVGTGGWINLADGTFSYSNNTSGNGISWDGSDLIINSDSISITSTGRTVIQEIDNAKSEVLTDAASDATNKADDAYANAILNAALDASDKADSAYNNAISDAAADAANKANAAQEAAISIAAADATNKANAAIAIVESNVADIYETKDNVSAINERLQTAETSISSNSNAISLKANISDVNNLSDIVDNHYTEYQQTANTVALYFGHNGSISTWFEFDENAFTIGKQNSPIRSIQDNSSYKYVDSSGTELLKIDTRGVTSDTVNIESQMKLTYDSDDQWAIRRGALVTGVGVNFDIVWIGG